MLRGLFKNTEDTPVVLDDGDEDTCSPPQSIQKKKKSTTKNKGKKKGKKPEKKFVKSPAQPSKRKLKEKEDGKDEGNDKVIENDLVADVKGKGKQKLVETKIVESAKEKETEKVIEKEIVEDDFCDNEDVINEEEHSDSSNSSDEDWKYESESSEGEFDSSEERMAISSCDEAEIKYPEFNEVTGMEDPKFELGMLFSSGKVFRDAVRKHAIVHQRPIRLKKNQTDKIKWRCTEGCEWKCYGIKQQRSSNIQIKTWYGKHTCNPTWVQKQVNSTWIAKAYEEEIRMNPTWKTSAFHSKVVNDLKCHISETMIYRAMRKAKEGIIGKHEDEFQKLYKYANEVKKVMPSSTIKLMTEPAEAGVEGRRFKRFYVCLGPLKEGFLDGCRPLIGLDGCHLKGPFGGILLTAVATDPNEGMYPIAWAQVEQENTSSWNWFLRLLKDDLRIQNASNYTFISDRQKGLVHALENHFSEAEHRFCVMHLYHNMKLQKEGKGLGVTKQMWLAAKSTTDYFFNMNMEMLKKLNKKSYEWLAAKPKSQWSRAGFRELCKSDVFVNNNCEVFNNAINKWRDNGIVTMFKNIHNSCMERIQKRKTKMEKTNVRFCPKIMKKINKSIAQATKAVPVWNGGHKYHVTMSAGGHEVVCDLKQRTCACRKWQLTGIPCFHAVACIQFRRKDPLDYIHECYSKKKYLQVYSHILEPISGEPYWEETEQEPPLPPLKKVAPGRPKKARDRKNDVETRENNPTMLKRKGTSLRCSGCGEWEHNVRSCPKKKVPQEGEEGEMSKWQTAKPKCSYCKEEGHNSRSCPSKKLDDNTKKRQRAAENEEIFKEKLAQLQKSQREMYAHKSASKSPVKNVKSFNHGGILKPFKPPAQSGPSGVDYFERNGDQFTTLGQLLSAIKKKKAMKKKKK